MFTCNYVKLKNSLLYGIMNFDEILSNLTDEAKYF